MKQEDVFEVNFDGLIGPTHGYGGLSLGNIHSEANKHMPSNPKLAALQGLQKMKLLHDMGIKQAILPPHERPNFSFLRTLGYCGTDYEIALNCYKENPLMYVACCSASSMWAANAAIVTPSSDSKDGKVHFTAANLSYNFHRHLEAEETFRYLKLFFPNEELFAHHQPLKGGIYFADEGSANHMRFSNAHHKRGLHVFCWGRKGFGTTTVSPKKYPARQTLESAHAIALRHGIAPDQVIFLQQNPQAIDAGVFHNDVISTNNEYLFFYHEDAFAESNAVEQIQSKASEIGCTLNLLKVERSLISLEEAVNSYLFNVQIVTLPNKKMAVIAPVECRENDNIVAYLENIAANTGNPISSIHYADLRQSMRNGGGPACLRLRVLLKENEFKYMHQGILLNDDLYSKLVLWIEKYYRDRLFETDLIDKAFIEETKTALDELSKLLKMEHLYNKVGE